jgi:hypothetical protein
LPDTSCAVFAAVDLDLDSGRIHRFVVGEDAEPRPMSAAEAENELGDPFARLLLLRGTFPGTADDTVTAIRDAAPGGDRLRRQMSFLLGEGGKIPFEAGTASLQRGLRFVVTLGASTDGPPEGPDVLLSAFGPRSADIELMAWDGRRGGFNYYRAVGRRAAWVFAGNSRHALVDPTQGKGPFESHRSGAFLMKELKLPWVHWDSPESHILPTAFAEDDDRRRHEWFTQKQPGGAYTLEVAVARPAINRWARARFDAITANGGVIERPGRIMEQILTTPTANIVSSVRESRSTSPTPSSVGLPPTFFADVEGLRAAGLLTPPPFDVPDDIYQASLRRFEVRLSDERGFVQPGDTHFAFVVPERALEDQVVLREAVRSGLVTPRLAACLLMVDFPNPIFSDRRAALLAHVPETATVSDGASGFSQEMADAVVAAAETSPQASPEREFAERWAVGEDFLSAFDDLLARYYEAVRGRLGTQAGFDDYFALAESRRRRGIEEMPIFRENPLLFAHSNVPPARRAMRADGSVA